MSPASIPWRLLVVVLTLLAAASPARAGSVSFDLSARETYFGAPIEFKVIFVNVKNETRPDPPVVENGQVLGAPSRGMFHSTDFTGGRVRSKKEVTYTFQVRPLAVGRMVITPAPVSADGEVYEGGPFEVAVVKSETGDLLFAEIIAGQDAVYLGEPLDVRLRIWIKPFRDRRLGTLSESFMWTRVDQERSRLGLFGKRLQELAQDNRRPKGREVLREDAAGTRRNYLLYEIPTQVWPDRAGPFDPGPVEVVVRYPLRVVRDMFELRATRDRPLIVEAAVPAVEVLTPPEDGRPPWFNGAVGTFDFEVSARPTEVAVGDPITITMQVRDRTAKQRAHLAVLQPPPLARVAELTESFRMPSDPLAGEIDGRTKSFTQTLRARNDGVERIPPIPFTYFDPDRAEYVTLHSTPVPLTVTPASSMSMADVVGGESVAPTELTQVNAGLVANAGGADVLLATRPMRPPAWWLAVLLAPPLLFGVTVLAQRRAHRARHDTGWVRQRRARREALRLVTAAGRVTGDEQAHLIGDAISGYVADRCNLPAGAVTRAEVVRTLRDGSVKTELIEEVEGLLAAGEAARYAGAAAGDNGDLADRAKTLIDRLERERIG